ncbi:MAG: hypothetical protein WCS01_09255 [bacterium]
MFEGANHTIHEWASDVFEIYVPPKWPWEKCSTGPRVWDDWTGNENYVGQWETLDPFPGGPALMWDELMSRHAPQLYQGGNPVLREKLLQEWAGRFSSALIRVRISDYEPLNSSLAPEGPIPTNCHFVGAGQVARIEHWRRVTCGHQIHPQPGCPNSVREVIPVPPRLNMKYWIALVEDGDYRFTSVLETPLRVNLGAMGPVYVARSQQILEWYLPQAARILDRHWHLLPTVIGKSQLDDRFFRSNRTIK